MIKKVFYIVLCICLLTCSLFVPASAVENFTEYYEYNGQAISSSVADILSGLAVNTLRQFPDRFRCWIAFRVSEYRYAIVVFPDYDSYTLYKSTLRVTIKSCWVYFYNQRLASYTEGNQTRYQAGLEPQVIQDDISVQFTRGYVVGNVEGCISVHPDYELVLYFDYLKYILYTLVIFLFSFVAFKFLNKRWLLP